MYAATAHIIQYAPKKGIRRWRGKTVTQNILRIMTPDSHVTLLIRLFMCKQLNWLNRSEFGGTKWKVILSGLLASCKFRMITLLSAARKYYQGFVKTHSLLWGLATDLLRQFICGVFRCLRYSPYSTLSAWWTGIIVFRNPISGRCRRRSQGIRPNGRTSQPIPRKPNEPALKAPPLRHAPHAHWGTRVR